MRELAASTSGQRADPNDFKASCWVDGNGRWFTRRLGYRQERLVCSAGRGESVCFLEQVQIREYPTHPILGLPAALSYRRHLIDALTNQPHSYCPGQSLPPMCKFCGNLRRINQRYVDW